MQQLISKFKGKSRLIFHSYSLYICNIISLFLSFYLSIYFSSSLFHLIAFLLVTFLCLSIPLTLITIYSFLSHSHLFLSCNTHLFLSCNTHFSLSCTHFLHTTSHTVCPQTSSWRLYMSRIYWDINHATEIYTQCWKLLNENKPKTLGLFRKVVYFRFIFGFIFGLFLK